MQRELAKRRVDWHPEPQFPWDETLDDSYDALNDEAAGPDDIADAISDAVVRDALTPSGPRSDPPRTETPTSRGSESSHQKRPPLPNLDTVSPFAAATAKPIQRSGGHRGSGGGPWLPRTAAEQEGDRDLGRHGEQLVLREERLRVAALGLDADTVVWVAGTDPSADHDIRSVDDDGEPLYIEVKSTRGRDGRFSWPAAEFRLAVQERERYLLVRVYEAHTLTPTIASIRNPVQALLTGLVAINLESLTGDVGSVRPLEQPADGG
jgi:hypothetical protein